MLYRRAVGLIIIVLYLVIVTGNHKAPSALPDGRAASFHHQLFVCFPKIRLFSPS